MKSIAVVEDNADNRLLLRVLLEDKYRVIEYNDGPEALDGFAEELPELVLLDISLPTLDGLEVLARIRKDSRFRDLPVIAITAHATPGDRARFISAGFNGYVSKPIVDENILFEAIRAHLGD